MENSIMGLDPPPPPPVMEKKYFFSETRPFFLELFVKSVFSPLKIPKNVSCHTHNFGWDIVFPDKGGCEVSPGGSPPYTWKNIIGQKCFLGDGEQKNEKIE